MVNEELIYRITRAVYDRLGTQAEEQTVEQLVADIYRIIQPSLTTSNSNTSTLRDAAAAQNTGSADRLIISVFGIDNPGIVAGVAHILSTLNFSIMDINQTVVQGKFAMIIIANRARATVSVAELTKRLRDAGEKLGVFIYTQREDLFNSMHRI